MDDLLYLTAQYRVTIAVVPHTMGTSGGTIFISATVTLENGATKLTGSATASGVHTEHEVLRGAAICDALTIARRKAEAIEGLF